MNDITKTIQTLLNLNLRMMMMAIWYTENSTDHGQLRVRNL